MEEDNLKGGKENMEIQISKREKHLQKCPFCDEKPSGFGLDALIYNFERHLDKHFRHGEITKEEMISSLKRLSESIKEIEK